MGELQGELQRITGAAGMDAQGCANVWAGTSNLDLVGALNAKAGTVGLELNGVCKALGLAFGGSSELDGPGAIASIPGIGHGGTGWDATANRYWLSATTTNLNTATASVTLGACVTAPDWTPAAIRDICGWGGAAVGLCLGLNTAGTLRLRIDQADATSRTAASSVGTGFTDSATAPHWVALKVTDAGVSGTVSFFTAPNSSLVHPGFDVTAAPWVALGTAGATITSWNGTYRTMATAIIGSSITGVNMWSGRIHSAFGCIDGVVPTWAVDFSHEQHALTAITDDKGLAWTATGTNINVVRA
jgi:hypothetical protein